MNREEWLGKAAVVLNKRVLVPAGLLVEGQLRMSCGWPSRKAFSTQGRCLGQCWSIEASADGTTEVFVSPSIDDPMRVLDVVLHELVHAAIGVDKKHNPAFKRAAEQVGLAGKPTATYVEPGSDLEATLTDIAMKLGPYPHATLDKSVMPKEGTRLLKVVCPECTYTVRITRKWIEVGLPTCPCGTEMEEA